MFNFIQNKLNKIMRKFTTLFLSLTIILLIGCNDDDQSFPAPTGISTTYNLGEKAVPGI